MLLAGMKSARMVGAAMGDRRAGGEDCAVARTRSAGRSMAAAPRVRPGVAHALHATLATRGHLVQNGNWIGDGRVTRAAAQFRPSAAWIWR